MTDPEGAESQADDATQPQAGDQQDRPQADRNDTEGKDGKVETISLEKAKELRQEAAQLRRRLAAAESKVQAAEDRDKSELEKAQQAATRLERELGETAGKLRAERAERRIYQAAGKAGAVAPEAIFKLVRDDVEYAEDGAPTNVEDVIADAKKTYPQLFRAASGRADGGAKDEREPSGDMNQLMRRVAGYRSS